MDKPDTDITIISQPNDFTFIEQWYELADQNHFWMVWRLAAFLNQARSLKIPLDQPLRGMEIGCGHGVLRGQIEQHTVWTVDGTEIDLTSLKRNVKGRGQLFFYDILEQREQFKEKYDFLFLYDVLEHIEQTSPFLDSCAFMLKKTGLLFVNVPAIQTLFSPYDTAAGHYRRYSSKSLSAEFNKDKFKVLDVRYWGFSLVPVLMLRKLVLKDKLDPAEIIRSGFKPPHSLINSSFKGLMSLETSIVKRPPLGTSALAVLRKL